MNYLSGYPGEACDQ